MLKLLPFFLFISVSHAQVGEILSLRGSDSFLSRNGTQSSLTEGTKLEVGDSVHSGNGHVTLILFPKIQMGLSKGTELKITRHMVAEANTEKTESLIELVKGLIRVQVSRDPGEEVQQGVHARDITFAVRGTEYEVSTDDEMADLDVFEGEVEVSSPHVQTFVPEIVKPREGFRFDRKKRQFARRAHRENLKNVRFLRKEEIRSRWQERKAERKNRLNERKNKRLQDREARKTIRKEKRGRGR